MSSAGISFGGLGSGLDTRAIISALMAVEQRPITALETKKASLNSSKNLFGDFKKLLSDLDTKAKSLRTTTDFLQMKAASSNEDLLTVRAGANATPGSYQIKVMAMASSEVSVSNGRAAKDDPVFGALEIGLLQSGERPVRRPEPETEAGQQDGQHEDDARQQGLHPPGLPFRFRSGLPR